MCIRDRIYTHDPRLMEKLDLLAKKHPDQITRKDAHNFPVPKRCVSVREPYSACLLYTSAVCLWVSIRLRFSED